MKTSYKFRYYYLVLFIVSAASFALAMLYPEIPEYVRYISVFFGALSLSLSYLAWSGSDSQNRIDWLERRMKLWNSISYRVKKAGEMVFNDLPLAIIVYNDKKEIEWANNYAKDVFQSPLFERRINLIHPELYKKMTREEVFDIELYGKIFECKNVIVDNILYMMDKTEMVKLERRYNQRMLTIGVLNLDNFDQALSVLEAQEKALQISNIIGILGEWSNKHKIYLKGFSEEKYLLIMDLIQLEDLIKEKFKILDTLQDYCLKENLRISASIGIACQDANAIQLVEIAEKQLTLAMDRGGNQCVVSIDNNISYYGAKFSAPETRSPVFIRVKTEELADMIKRADSILVISHVDMDADAFGSCIGIKKIAQSLGKDAKIVFDKSLVDQTVLNVTKVIEQEHVNLLNMFVTTREALTLINENTLLIIADCQYQNLLMSEKIYKKAKKIALIDHHRRNNFAISNYVFIYPQPSASSTVELVVEMFEFLDMSDIEISPIEATCMLMGIIVDTNSLTYRTSYRTFNVLAVLQRYGADMSKAKRYLRENFDDYIKRIDIINKMEIIDSIYGIAVCNDKVYQRQFLAKIADGIITINNIKAGFCIGNIESGEVGISARSLDETNVQIIMEQLGGGGHFNNSAAQLEGVTIEQAKAMLIEKLTTIYEGENQKMKIILVKDVKGKGKIGDIIDIPSGHANFLIRSSQAIEATPDNIKQLEAQQLEEKQKAEKYLNDMKKLKKEIEDNHVTIKVKVGKNGKLFGSVSAKQITDEYKLQNRIELDKRKMMYEKDIDALGTYTIPIQLHKEVIATITVYVVEGK